MKPTLIAELGINHGGDVDVAIHMAKIAAVECGADAVKLQYFNPKKLTEYRRGDKTMLDTLSACYLTLKELQQVQRALGPVPVFASVFDPDDVKPYHDAGFDWVKLSVEQAQRWEMWDAVARAGFDVAIASVGPRADIKRIPFIAGMQQHFLWCPAGYPVMTGGALHLHRIGNWLHAGAGEANSQVGLSLHTPDHLNYHNAIALAYGYGARIFELHFGLESQPNCRERAWSLDESDFLTVRYLLDELAEMAGEGN